MEGQDVVHGISLQLVRIRYVERLQERHGYCKKKRQTHCVVGGARVRWAEPVYGGRSCCPELTYEVNPFTYATIVSKACSKDWR